MDSKEPVAEQTDLTRHARRLAPNTLSPLSKLTLAALLGNALLGLVAFLQLLFMDGVVVIPLVIIVVVTSLAAGAVAARWRWAPLLGAGVALTFSVLPLAMQQTTYQLTHPAPFVPFSLMVLGLACALVAIVAGVGATLHNYQGGRQALGLPRWASLSLSGLSGIVVGMFLVSLIVTTVPQKGAATSISTGEPAVHMTADNFAQNVVLAPLGSHLLIIADSSVEHILAYGRWDTSGAPHPLVEPGAPPLSQMVMTGGSMEIGPFMSAGVYHLYCTIHRGMNLTIVVQ
jgi:hypothetical protein